MTQEEKAKAYDEAVKKAREIAANPNRILQLDDFEELFPGISDESEDERIRKEIYSFFKNFKETGTYKSISDINVWIAYLEKQKEKSMSATEVLARAGLKPYKDGNQWCILAGDNIQEGICGFGDTIDEALYQFLMEVLEKQKEPEKSIDEDGDFTIYHPLKCNGKYECIPYSFFGSLTSFSNDRDLIDFLRSSFYTEEECEEWIEKQKENIEKEYVFRPLAGTDITVAAKQAIRRANEGDRLVLAFNGAYIPVRKGCNANKIVDIYNAFIEKQKEPLRDFIDDFPYSDEQKEHKPVKCELEDAFKYYTDAGITISCGDIVAKPKEQKPIPLMNGDADLYFDNWFQQRGQVTSRQCFKEGIKYIQRLQKEQKSVD